MPYPLTRVLLAARARIQDPSHWTTQTYARDSQGTGCDPLDPVATQWCILGALYYANNLVAPYESCSLACAELQRFQPDPHSPLDAFNDSPDTTHADVLSLFDRAIEAFSNEG